VTVQGLVTVDTDTLSTTDNIFYIQDVGAGLMVQEFFTQTLHLTAGDNVLVTGFVDSFQGQTFLSAPSSIEILSQGGAPPTPIVLTTNELATVGETWENMLVELRDVSVVAGSWPAPGFDGTLTIDDGSGPATLEIDADTSLDDLGAPAEPTFWVRGVVVQRAQSTPYTCCWAVLPRFGVDVFQPVGVGVLELPSHHATERTVLHPSRPNPLRTTTRVRFDLAGTTEQAVRVAVFDVGGRHVRTLVDDRLPPGEFETSWDGRGRGGKRVAAGVYFVRLVARDVDTSRKVVVLE